MTYASAANPIRAAVEGQQHLVPPLEQLLGVAVAVVAAVAAAVVVAAVAAVVDSKLLLKISDVRF